MNILGLSCFYHDSAAALIMDGRIVAAAQEERFTRKKHDPAFPSQSIRFCLDQAGLTGADIDHVVFYEKPFLKFERIVENHMAVAPRGYRQFGRAIQGWMTDKLFQRRSIGQALHAIDPALPSGEALCFSEHHLSHAASAFYPSPFASAAVLCVDGVGEHTTTSAWVGDSNGLRLIREIAYPHSLGLLYSAMTYYCGFKVNSGEYKLMGLAPYGRPVYADLIRDHLIDIRDDGSYALDLSYFGYRDSLRMTNARWDALFGGPAHSPEKAPTQKQMDLAASVQEVLEEVMLKMTRWLARETGESALCLAGGVALNCVANAKLAEDNAFDTIFIQPAAGDAGGALGAALALHQALNGERPFHPPGSDGMSGCHLGPTYHNDEIATILTKLGAQFEMVPLSTIISHTAQALADGRTVAWVQGRMEFGPRALGNRSILADPRGVDVQRTLNLKIKFRESFRPFAPAVLREQVEQWFEGENFSPYMLLTNTVKASRRVNEDVGIERFGLDLLNHARSQVPAITHVDNSARVQVVDQATNPLFHALISRFAELTDCPMLVNTSFNVRGEPIVCTPQDAFRCFMHTDLDLLVIGNSMIWKDQQNVSIASLKSPMGGAD